MQRFIAAVAQLGYPVIGVTILDNGFNWATHPAGGKGSIVTDTTTASEALDEAARRQLAADLYNHTWTLLEIADRTHVVALGITTDGVKIPLGLWEGSTENATLARSLLSDLVDRGLDPE